MSHFTVLVAGEDYDDQMAPFCEDLECVPDGSKWFNVEVNKGEAHEWIKSRLKTIKERVLATQESKDLNSLKYYSEELAKLEVLKTEEEMFEFIKESESYEEDEDGNLGYFTNDSFWDWYSIGGRWTGYFKLKEGKTGVLGDGGVGMFMATPEEKAAHDEKMKGRADQALKRDIDLPGMFKEHVHQLKERWEKAQDLIKRYPNFVSFEDYKPDAPIEDRRNEFNSMTQEGAKEINEFLGWSGNLKDYKITRNEYIKKYRDNCILPFGFLANGDYVSNEHMGWWGCTTKREGMEDYNAKFWAWWKQIDDDELVSALDCHV